ncbi:helix-turn-helix transcriptional regulator [Actinoallomurus rhizosphaericola]|uniref:helix-turn-helix transcriptional regulator n=1 Tax=Actinoallomurus rhizosphaericola TaxID=2952536 RepID=UPI0020937FD5|nr:transcriptional regulator [Actinoallomurus rhizosphaericola]MCO5997103.1 transcriptional regulator [Actinoallomurus rhizosphaericola]
MNDVDAIAALQDPVRRRLYDYVAAQDHEVGRAEAADAAGVQRTLAAFHLDRLTEAGLLDAVFRRPAGRSGPGAGRPAKLYRRSAAERAVSLPPRDYRVPAELLAEVVEEVGGEEILERLARRRGRSAGAAAAGEAGPHAGEGPEGEGMAAALRARGYEPYRDGADLRLRNCPFHALAVEFPPVVCGMNLALLEGLIEGLGATGVAARMDPRPGECCVVLVSKNNES